MTATETRTYVLPHAPNIKYKENELFDSLVKEHYTVDVHYFVETVVVVATRAVEI